MNFNCVFSGRSHGYLSTFFLHPQKGLEGSTVMYVQSGVVIRCRTGKTSWFSKRKRRNFNGVNFTVHVILKVCGQHIRDLYFKGRYNISTKNRTGAYECDKCILNCK